MKTLRTPFSQIAFWAWFVSAVKIATTYLFFQSSPRAGTAVTNATSFAFVYLVGILIIAKRQPWKTKQWPSISRWILAYVAWSGLSLAWTQASSLFAAVGYWAGYAAELLVVAMLLAVADAETIGLASLKGYIAGNLVLLLIALLAPGTSDLRMGEEEFLHPNALGYQFAMAALFAVFLCVHQATRQQNRWKIAAMVLTLATVRTLSKSSIIAYVIAAGFFLFAGSKLKLGNKVKVALAALLILVACLRLVETYVSEYTAKQDNYVTLTGRTIIWAQTFDIASEAPWLGHGFYSYRTVVPPFGEFEAWQAHNEWLQQWFSYGAVGLVLSMGAYLCFYRQLRRLRHSPVAPLATMLLVYSLVHGLTEADHVQLMFPVRLMLLITVWMAASKVAPEREGAQFLPLPGSVRGLCELVAGKRVRCQTQP